jgi:FdhE protein
MAAHAGVSADLAWLVSELALAPFAYLVQCRTLSTDHQRVASARRAWDRGFCPACGSWPAVIEGADTKLRCSFCAADWQLSSYRCLYCGNDDETFITAAPNPEEPGRRLQLCGGCGGYVKVLDLTTAFPMAAVEDLASMDLDMVAIARKYLRPPLPEIKRR